MNPIASFRVRGVLIADRRQVGDPINDRLICEASDIRVPIGRWPESIILDGDPDDIGRAREGFTFNAAFEWNGELSAVVYKARSGVELHVLND
jgi:hypothetical protein